MEFLERLSSLLTLCIWGCALMFVALITKYPCPVEGWVSAIKNGYQKALADRTRADVPVEERMMNNLAVLSMHGLRAGQVGLGLLGVKLVVLALL